MALEIYSYTEASALLEGSHFAGAGLYQLTKPLHEDLDPRSLARHFFSPLMREKDKPPQNSKIIPSLGCKKLIFLS